MVSSADGRAPISAARTISPLPRGVLMGFDDDQLTLAQAVELLGLSPATLKQQAHKGTLAARKVGVTTRNDVEPYRREHLGRVGRPGKPADLEGLLAAIGHDLENVNRRPPTTGRKAVWNESAATPGTSPDSQWPLGTALARYAPHHGCAQTRAE